MKPSSTVNLAIVLAVLGWLLCVYGILSQMGDPSPSVPREVIATHQRTSNAVLFLGIFSLLSAIWLSGFAFLAAKWRACIALAVCILPLTVLFGYALVRF